MIIDFVKCPRCKKEFIRGDWELVCQDCGPGMQADLDLQELLSSLSSLEELDPSILVDRVKILNNLITRLKKLHKEVSNVAASQLSTDRAASSRNDDKGPANSGEQEAKKADL